MAVGAAAGRLFATLNLDSGKFTAGLMNAGRALSSFDRKISATSASMLQMNKLLAGAAIAGGLGLIASKAIRAGEELEGFERRVSVLANAINENTLEVTTANREMDFLVGTAIKTGQSFDILAKSYARVVPNAVANGIALDKVKDAMIGTIGAGAVLGASQEEMKRAFIAIGQVVGKNALQMEELRQQLGEALPNAMLIASTGLTELWREQGKIAEDATVPIGKLVKMISQSEIDGAMFIEIWKRGTAEFVQFAEAASNTVSGQLQNMQTLMTVGVGQFMRRSGLQASVTSMLKLLNDEITNFFDMSDEKARSFGDSIVNGIFDGIESIATFLDETMSFNSALFDTVIGAIEIFATTIVNAVNEIRSIPGIGPVLAELGLIGALLFGIKGKLLFIGIAAVAGIVNDIIDAIGGAEKQLSALSRLGTNQENASEDGADASQIEKQNQALRQEVEAAIGNDKMDDFLSSSSEERGVILESAKRELERQNEIFHGGLVELREQIAQMSEEEGREALRQAASNPQQALRDENPFALTEAWKKEIEENSNRIASIKELSEVIRDDVRLIENNLAEGLDASGSPLVEEEFALTDGVKSLRERFNDMRSDVENINRTLREMGFNIQVSEQSLLNNLSSSQIRQLLNRWLTVLSVGEEIDNPIGRIAAQLEKDRARLEDEWKYLEELEFDRSALEGALLSRTLGQIADIKSSETVDQVRADLDARREAFEEYVAQLKSAVGPLNSERNEEIQNLRRQLEQRGARFIRSARDREFTEASFTLEREIENLERIKEAETGALDVLIQRKQERELVDALAKREQMEIAFGLRSQSDAMFSLNEQQLQANALTTKRKGLEEELIRFRYEQEFLQDAEVKRLNRTLLIERQRAELEQQRIELNRLQNDGEFRDGVVQQQLQAMQLERENLILRRQVLGSPDGQRELLSLEMERLRLESQNLENQLLLGADPEARMTMIEQEIMRAQLEGQNLERQIELAQNPAFIQQQNQNDVMGAQLQTLELMRTYTQDLQTAFAVGLPTAISSFTSALSSNITNTILGIQTIGDLFRNIIGMMLQGLVGFFVEWAVRQAAAWVMENVFQVGRATLAGTTNAAILGGTIGTLAGVTSAGVFATSIAASASIIAAGAVAAAWLPAALLASIATFGGAAGTGFAALATAMGSSIGLFASFKAATTALSLATFHDGGIVGKGAFGSDSTGRLLGDPLKDNEVVAKLEKGEMVLTEEQQNGMFSALSSANVSAMSAGTRGVSFGGVHSAETMDSMSQERTPQIVNYFDFADVERHLARNPDAILNTIVQDDRNRGRTTKLQGSRRR